MGRTKSKALNGWAAFEGAFDFDSGDDIFYTTAAQYTAANTIATEATPAAKSTPAASKAQKPDNKVEQLSAHHTSEVEDFSNDVEAAEEARQYPPVPQIDTNREYTEEEKRELREKFLQEDEEWFIEHGRAGDTFPGRLNNFKSSHLEMIEVVTRTKDGERMRYFVIQDKDISEPEEVPEYVREPNPAEDERLRKAKERANYWKHAPLQEVLDLLNSPAVDGIHVPTPQEVQKHVNKYFSASHPWEKHGIMETFWTDAETKKAKGIERAKATRAKTKADKEARSKAARAAATAAEGEANRTAQPEEGRRSARNRLATKKVQENEAAGVSTAGSSTSPAADPSASEPAAGATETGARKRKSESSNGADEEGASPRKKVRPNDDEEEDPEDELRKIPQPSAIRSSIRAEQNYWSKKKNDQVNDSASGENMRDDQGLDASSARENTENVVKENATRGKRKRQTTDEQEETSPKPKMPRLATQDAVNMIQSEGGEAEQTETTSEKQSDRSKALPKLKLKVRGKKAPQSEEADEEDITLAPTKLTGTKRVAPKKTEQTNEVNEKDDASGPPQQKGKKRKLPSPSREEEAEVNSSSQNPEPPKRAKKKRAGRKRT